MKTIEIKVYEFGELSEQAQQKAIDILRERAARQARDQDWGEASESIRKLEEIAHVKTDIEYSSHGFYTRWYKNTDPNYDITDEQEFDEFRKNFEEQFKGDMWYDYMLREAVRCAEFYNDYTYEYTISNIILKFCNKVEEGTLGFYDDDYVVEWILGNDIMFFEDGRPIIEELL